MRIIPVVGEIRSSSEGERTLSMKLIDPSGEGSAVSSAVLTPAGNSLSGKTKQEILGTNAAGSAASASTEYGWRAVKFTSKATETSKNSAR